jgi:hypothetical protein
MSAEVITPETVKNRERQHHYRHRIEDEFATRMWPCVTRSAVTSDDSLLSFARAILTLLSLPDSVQQHRATAIHRVPVSTSIVHSCSHKPGRRIRVCGARIRWSGGGRRRRTRECG